MADILKKAVALIVGTKQRRLLEDPPLPVSGKKLPFAGPEYDPGMSARGTVALKPVQPQSKQQKDCSCE